MLGSDDLQLRYRRAIGRFATGVAVITTMVDDRPVGMTASAVASLSLEPAMLPFVPKEPM